jgi:hypothetical protein
MCVIADRRLLQSIEGCVPHSSYLLAEAARIMPHATRIRIQDREHINAFLYSEFVVPRVIEFLATWTSQATG